MCKKGLFGGSVILKWDPVVQKMMDNSLAKAKTGEEWKKEVIDNKDFQWTMIHGDSHFGNYIYHTEKKCPIMLDMECAGFGNGPCDLAVWMMLRTNPAWRRKYEDEILNLYYEGIIESAAKHEGANLTKESYTFEQMKFDYGHRGFARVVFYATGMATVFGQHVTEDLLANMKDFAEQHGVTAENVPAFIF